MSPARGAGPGKPSNGLLVMMPPTVGPKPVGKVTAIPPLKALRWVLTHKLTHTHTVGYMSGYQIDMHNCFLQWSGFY